MTNSNVNLIIKAKDQASKSVLKVQEALDKLEKAQKDLSGSSGNVSGVFGELNRELVKLQSTVQGLEIFKTVVSDLKASSVAVDELRQNYKNNRDELNKLLPQITDISVEYYRLAKAAKDSSNKLVEIESTLRRVSEEKRKQREENTKSNQAAKEELKVLNSLKKEYNTLNSSTEKNKKALKDLEAQVLASSIAYKQLSDQAKSGAEKLNELQKVSKELSKIKLEQKQISLFDSQNLSSQEKDLRNIQKVYRSLSSEINKSAVDLDRGVKAFNELDAVAKKASVALGGVALDQKGVAEASSKATDQIKKLNDQLSRKIDKNVFADLKVDNSAGLNQTINSLGQANKLYQEYAEKARIAANNLKEFQETSKNSGKLTQDQVTDLRILIAENTRYQQQLKSVGEEYSRFVNQVKSNKLNQLKDFKDQAEKASKGTEVLTRNNRGLAASLKDVSNQADDAADSIENQNKAKSRAITLSQQLRRQTLSLIATYIGLYEAFNQIGRIVEAYRTLEAAQSRLGAVLGGNTRQIQSELGFVLKESDRLGLSFGTLADEYSKLTVATQENNLSLDVNRKLFTAIAEASRVNKLTNEEVQGTFLAFTQIINKQKVQAEELVKQLSQRLPGAISIFARAANVDPGELFDVLRNGDFRVTEESLKRIAEEIISSYRGGVPAALRTATTALDQFKNNVFQARLAVAEGGFLDELNKSVRDLNVALRSDEGKEFFTSLGQAIGFAVKAVTFLIKQSDLLIYPLKALVSLKIINFITELGASMSRSSTAARDFATNLVAFGTATKSLAVSSLSNFNFVLANTVAQILSMVNGLKTYSTAQIVAATRTAASSVVLAGFSTAIGLASKAVKLLQLSLGFLAGPLVGLLSFFAVEAIVKWISKVDDASDALQRHEKVVADVQQRYDEAAGTVQERFAAAVENVDEIQLRLDKQDVEKQLEKLKEDLQIKASVRVNDPEVRQMVIAFRNLVAEFKNGQKTAAEVNDEIEKLDNKSEVFLKLARQLKSSLDEAEDLEIKLGEMDSILSRIAGSASDAAAELLGLVNTKPNLNSLDILRDNIATKISEIQNQIPAFEKQFKFEKAISNVRQSAKEIKEGLDQLPKLSPEAKDLFDQLPKGVKDLFDGLPVGIKVRTSPNSRETQQLTSEIVDDLVGQYEKSLKDQIFGSPKKTTSRGRSTEDRAAEQRARELRQEQEQIARFYEQLRENNQERLFELEISKETKREQAILREIQKQRNAAAKLGIKDIAEEEKIIRSTVGAVYDLENAERVRNEKKEELVGRVNDLLTTQRNLQEQIQFFEENLGVGNFRQIQDLKDKLSQVNKELPIAIKNAKNFAISIGDEKTVQQLELIAFRVSIIGEQGLISQRQLEDTFANTGTSALDGFAQSLAAGENAFKSLGAASRQFFVSFLRDISKAIIQAILLRAISSAITSAFGGGSFGPTGGVPGPNPLPKVIQRHSGGMVNLSGRKMAVNPFIFAGAQRFHNGGIPGLASNEVPAILQRGEEVLTRKDPRHAFNGGSGGANIKVINTFEPAEMLNQALSSTKGQEIFINAVKNNSDTVKSLIGS